jgi:PPM family protein phosphatase
MQPGNIYYLYEIGGKKTQEDYIWPLAGKATNQDKIFIVCDGVGGSDNGEIASKMISESMGNALQKMNIENITSGLINDQLDIARQKLVEYAQTHQLNRDMATTFCMIAMAGKKTFITWSGDSRVYHLRDGEILYKTSDHSLVNTLVKKGEITEEDALLHPQKNVILKAIKADGSPIETEDIWIENAKEGDYFLLCTDGLLENITEKDIKFLLNQNDNGHFDLINAFQQKCFNRTRDNYSMYLVKIQNDERPVTRPFNLFQILLFLFVIAATFLIGILFFSKNNNGSRQPSPVLTKKDSIPAKIVPAVPKDSLPFVEIVNSAENDSDKTKEAEKKRNERPSKKNN